LAAATHADIYRAIPQPQARHRNTLRYCNFPNCLANTGEEDNCFIAKILPQETLPPKTSRQV
jgi:hypothetical protein